MTMHRFYLTDLDGDIVQLDAEQSQHARKSLRLGAGDEVELFDGRGTVAAGHIEQAGKQMNVAISQRLTLTRPRPRIELATALPKGARADVLIEKASELGADRIIPLITERSVVDPRSGKLDRFRRLAIESAKQSERAWLMEVAEPTPLNALLQNNQADLKLLADLTDDAAIRVLPTLNKVIVLIGPEGGWTDDERIAAKDHGFVPWRFGPNVLRTETAAIAAVAILRQGR